MPAALLQLVAVLLNGTCVLFFIKKNTKKVHMYIYIYVCVCIFTAILEGGV